MAAEGKLFYIKSHLNGLVLDVEGGQQHPGTRVVTWQQKPMQEAHNQLWYVDSTTGTINSKMNNFCLDIASDSLVIKPYEPGNPNQQWYLNGQRFQNRLNPELVLDIANCDSSPGARVCAWNYNGQNNQHWHLEYVGSRDFFIKSEMNGKVVDIEGGNPSPGTKVIMWQQKFPPEKNQLWYEDMSGIIRSKLNDSVMDSSGNNYLNMQPFNPNNPKHQWIIDGNKITNRFDPTEVLDIARMNHSDGAQLCAYRYKGSSNQHWRIEYI